MSFSLLHRPVPHFSFCFPIEENIKILTPPSINASAPDLKLSFLSTAQMCVIASPVLSPCTH